MENTSKCNGTSEHPVLRLFLIFSELLIRPEDEKKSSFEYSTFIFEDRQALNLGGSVLPREPSANTSQFHGGGLVERASPYWEVLVPPFTSPWVSLPEAQRKRT